MKTLFYRLLNLSGRLFGAWFFAVISRCIAAGYFIFSNKVVESHRFYQALFPSRSFWYQRYCTFRQYQNFTTIHLDRFLTNCGQPPCYTSRGWDQLAGVIGNEGGILLMSHLGNWEMAAHILKQQQGDLQILLYMGVKEKEGVERMQKEVLRRAGVTIIGVDKETASPFSVVEGIRYLQKGGLISLSGDIVWQEDQRQVQVTFLGQHAYLPAAPYIFALVSGAPLFVFFTFRTGSNAYHFTVSEPIVIRPVPRQERREAIARAAQQYADLLEEALREHPLEWYHFDRFLQ